MKKIIRSAVTVSSLALFSFASAHVVITPKQVNVGVFQTFDMGVPTEKDVPTVSLRLLLPPGLNEVSPNVKPGWYITEKKTGDDVTEIDWVGGRIPVDERDDFYFSAQAPAASTTLIWKAYQTYADGSVVSWDMNPNSIPSGEEGTPYSMTRVIDDLTTSPATSPQNNNAALGISVVALILALGAMVKVRKP